MNIFRANSGSRQDWETPDWLFEQLHREFDFEIDACAHSGNAKLSTFWSIEDDALSLDWGQSRVWCNPPYGRGIGKWVQKAYTESLLGSTVVLLLPASTDTRWWHDYCMKGEIRFLRGRLKFKGAVKDCPFACAVVIFGLVPIPMEDAS